MVLSTPIPVLLHFVMAPPTFLAKHPAYLRYVHEVASRELVMPEYERVGELIQVALNEWGG